MITSTAIVMVDIDHFKKFNAYYGHPAGDECLRQVGAVLNNAVHRNAHLVGRFGSEEFIALLPETGLQDVISVAERIRKMIEKAANPNAASPTAPVVPISGGVAEGTVHSTADFQTIFKRLTRHSAGQNPLEETRCKPDLLSKYLVPYPIEQILRL